MYPALTGVVQTKGKARDLFETENPKFENLSLGTTNMNKTEVDFNNQFLDVVEDVKSSFYENQLKEANGFISLFLSGNADKDSDQYKEIDEMLRGKHLEFLKRHMKGEEAPDQEELMREYLMKPVQQACNLILSSDPKLASLAMITSKKKRKEERNG